MLSPSLTLAEMPKSFEDPQLTRQAAMLMIRELGSELKPDDWLVNRHLSYMDAATAVAAVDGDTVLGIGMLDVVEPEIPVGTIVGLAVAPGHRGDGLGRDIVSMLEQRAKETNLVRLEVQSSYDARGFYERLGYRWTRGADFEKIL